MARLRCILHSVMFAPAKRRRIRTGLHALLHCLWHNHKATATGAGIISNAAVCPKHCHQAGINFANLKATLESTGMPNGIHATSRPTGKDLEFWTIFRAAIRWHACNLRARRSGLTKQALELYDLPSSNQNGMHAPSASAKQAPWKCIMIQAAVDATLQGRVRACRAGTLEVGPFSQQQPDGMHATSGSRSRHTQKREHLPSSNWMACHVRAREAQQSDGAHETGGPCAISNLHTTLIATAHSTLHSS